MKSGKACTRPASAALAEVMQPGPPQDWPLDAAQQEWGDEMAPYALGPNSRVRSERACKLLGRQPARTSVIDWIEPDMT